MDHPKGARPFGRRTDYGRSSLLTRFSSDTAFMFGDRNDSDRFAAPVRTTSLGRPNDGHGRRCAGRVLAVGGRLTRTVSRCSGAAVYGGRRARRRQLCMALFSLHFPPAERFDTTRRRKIAAAPRTRRRRRRRDVNVKIRRGKKGEQNNKTPFPQVAARTGVLSFDVVWYAKMLNSPILLSTAAIIDVKLTK